MAVETDIADALVSDLNSSSRSWTKTFTAERGWLTEIALEDLVRRVVVSPPNEDNPIVIESPVEGSLRTRHALQFDYPMTLTYQARVKSSATEDIDEENTTVQEIADRYAFDRLTFSTVTGHNSKPAWVVDLQRSVPYDRDKLREHNLFEAVLLVTVRLWRS